MYITVSPQSPWYFGQHLSITVGDAPPGTVSVIIKDATINSSYVVCQGPVDEGQFSCVATMPQFRSSMYPAYDDIDIYAVDTVHQPFPPYHVVEVYSNTVTGVATGRYGKYSDIVITAVTVAIVGAAFGVLYELGRRGRKGKG